MNLMERFPNSFKETSHNRYVYLGKTSIPVIYGNSNGFIGRYYINPGDYFYNDSCIYKLFTDTNTVTDYSMIEIDTSSEILLAIIFY